MMLVLVPHSKSPKKSLIGAHKAVCHCSSLGRLSCPPFCTGSHNIHPHLQTHQKNAQHSCSWGSTHLKKANISPVLRLLNCFLKVPAPTQRPTVSAGILSRYSGAQNHTVLHRNLHSESSTKQVCLISCQLSQSTLLAFHPSFFLLLFFSCPWHLCKSYLFDCYGVRPKFYPLSPKSFPPLTKPVHRQMNSFFKFFGVQQFPLTEPLSFFYCLFC